MSKTEKVKPLSKVVGRYFDAWIGRRTWYTGHLTDNQFFYKFVHAVIKYCKNGKRPSDSHIRQLIELKGSEIVKDANYLSGKASKFASLYASIIEFKDTTFPEPLIEQTDPEWCYHTLLQRSTKSEAEQWMRAQFGVDWKEKRNVGKRLR